jgi:hypothetical protein
MATRGSDGRSHPRPGGCAASGMALAADASGDDPDVFRLGSLLALGDVELDLLAFLEAAVAAAGDRAEVHEHVRAALRRDEAVALVAVESHHRALRHLDLLCCGCVPRHGGRGPRFLRLLWPACHATRGGVSRAAGHECRAARTPPAGQGAKAAETNTWAGYTRALHRRSPGMGATTGLAIPSRGKIWAAWRAAHRGLGCPAEWSP